MKWKGVGDDVDDDIESDDGVMMNDDGDDGDDGDSGVVSDDIENCDSQPPSHHIKGRASQHEGRTQQQHQQPQSKSLGRQAHSPVQLQHHEGKEEECPLTPTLSMNMSLEITGMCHDVYQCLS